MDGSSGEEGLSSVLRKGVEISSMEEGELDGSRRFDEQNPGSLLRRGLKFSSTGEFLNFLNEGEGSNESALSSSESAEVEEDEKQSDLMCKRTGVAGEMAEVNKVNATEVDKSRWPECELCGKKYSRKVDLMGHIRAVHLEKEAELEKSGWPECGLCGQKYSNRSNVKRHISNVHLGEVDCEDIKKHIISGQQENSKEGIEVVGEEKRPDPMRESATVEGEVAEDGDLKQADANVKVSEESGLICNHCCKLFKNNVSLIQHRHMGVYLMSPLPSQFWPPRLRILNCLARLLSPTDVMCL